MKKYFILLLSGTALFASDFNNTWYKTQEIYKTLVQKFEADQKLYDQNLIDKGWIDAQQRMAQLILGNPFPAFFHNQFFINFMLRTDVNRHESEFVNRFLSQSNKALITQFRDNPIGGLHATVPEYNCTASSFSHLYVLARILDQQDHNTIKTILEWGGGFGNLAHVAKKILPNVTYFIVDLLPLLAIQHLYLSLQLPDTPIKVHYDTVDSFEKGHIHLIPLYLVDKLNIQVDVMISAFALTECPFPTQKMVCEKKFFNASTIYISGIIHVLYLENGIFTDQIHDSMLKKYMSPNCNQFIMNPHYLCSNHFELLAKK